jgi:hypothetical protein
MSGHQEQGSNLHIVDFSLEVITPGANLLSDMPAIPLTGGLLGLLFMYLPETGSSAINSGKSAGGGHGH